MLELEHLSYWYKERYPVIQDLSLNISPGRIYGLLGINSVGKTTLLNLISGLLFPKAGHVLIDGKDVARREPETLCKIALMPSEIGFRSSLSIGDYVRAYSGFYPNFNREILDSCLDAFGIGPEAGTPAEMSLGQKHKAMLSILLSLGTDIILLDEPLNGMDIPSRSVFRKQMVRHLRDGQSIIISSHIVSDIENLITDVIILKEDGSCFSRSLGSVSAEYAFGVSGTPADAIYSEPCSEGFRVIREKDPGDETETEVSLEMLFNAVIKGIIK